MSYDSAAWRKGEWVGANQYYYYYEIRQNLLGVWMVLHKSHYKKRPPNGLKERWCSSYEEAIAAFNRYEKRCLNRGCVAV